MIFTLTSSRQPSEALNSVDFPPSLCILEIDLTICPERFIAINIPGEYEAVLKAVVTSGAFPTTEETLRHALKLLAKEQRVLDGSRPHNVPDPDDWEKQFRAWAASHPAVEVIVDDSRESMNEGRGL